jgi:phosphosulfolactate phosphohydrolase-like enzyme
MAAATQDERLSSRVFNSDVTFCSKADAFLYVVLNCRDPDEQKTEVPTSVSNRYHGC